MAEVKRAVERPVSPHLGIYRLQINMAMSIVHRITGGALYVGTLLLAVWLAAAAMGPHEFALVNSLLAHPLGLLVLLGYTWALIHHMLGGMRHLIWDTGRALDIKSVDRLVWLTVIASVIATAAVWAWALSLRGLSLKDLFLGPLT
jgi:succinate dehydrogenase / fumarate reductase cytochrome b subunit